MNRLSILLFSMFVLLVACDDSKKNRQILFDDVIKVHDEVMPEMGVLYDISEKLSIKADSLLVHDSLQHIQTYKELKQLSAEVSEANESMMVWMREFNEPSDDQAHEEVMEYLNDQKNKISAVKQNMLDAKKKGVQALSNY